MNYRKLSDTVRRNVTLDKCMADNLEAISTITGRSQSEFLEAALGQPIMRRLWAFAHPEDVNPIVELLETYQVYEGHMNPRTGEYILRAVKEWVEKHAVINELGLMQNASDVNSYISGHMTEGSKKADPYFKNIHRMAKMKLFITPNMKEEDLKDKVVKYIDTMLVNPTDKNIMGESYLYRNLLVIISECFEPPQPEEVKELFEELSDGYVLPSRNSMS